jgi:TPP-dependent pyruvate/acetoin dehydrogenase alpha subunit
MNAADLINFESKIKAAWEAGDLPCLLHLCGGNERELLRIFHEVEPGDWVFSTHRAHYHALLAGMPPEKVEAKIQDGRSMFLYSRDHNFLCSAVLAGCCGMAAGVAWQLKQEKSSSFVWCFIGDGGEEEGHFYEAAMFVEANDLPCSFIIEDNGRSVDTPKTIRRGSARGLEHLFKCVFRYTYTSTYPHAGSGCNFQIKFKPEAIKRLHENNPAT